jgi:hypothetical protein
MKSLNPRCLSLFVASTLALGAGLAQANPGFGEETFSVRLGGYFSDFDTNVRLSGPNGGDKVNLEDTLGLDSDQTVFRGALSWRFAPRHRLEIGYLDFQRDSLGTAEKSFVIETEDGIYEFAGGAELKTNFDWRLIPINYTYSFYRTDNLEVSASAGVHWFESTIGYEGTATVTPPGGSPNPVAYAAEAESASGPLPVFGLRADYALSTHWVIGARVGWFGLDYDDYSGELWDLGVSAEYWFSNNFGAGFGYSHYSIDVSEQDGAYTTGIDYTYDGVQVYVTYRY